MGSLGRNRTFVVKPHGSDLKIPSDLAGLTTCSYDWPRADTNHRAAVATASEMIRERIQKGAKRRSELGTDGLAGLDASAVKESNGVISAVVNGCEIWVRDGRIEQCEPSNITAVVLPCNEYFDDECAFDTRSALGAYVNKVFPAQIAAFMTLVREECKNRLGPGVEQQKRETNGH